MIKAITMNNIFSEYLNSIQKTLLTGDAREHAYRPAFQKLIEQLRPDITVINEPAYKGSNAPDFLFKKGEVPTAYAECKDINISLENKEVKAQANRYVDAFGKILLTNYLEFEILDDNNDPIKFKIAEIDNQQIKPLTQEFERASNLLKDYINTSYQSIKSAKKLAKIMASKARLLRDNTLASLEENPESDIMQQYETFKQVLVRELTKEQFTDMYAQTLVYGLFVARYFDPTLPTFSRHEAQDLLPNTNPLLKKFFGHVAGVNYDPKISWMVDGLIEAYLATDVHGLMHKEFKRKQKDPVLHFYETFLTEYDPKLRKSRGVYYTPEPVVSFMVRSVDEILKRKFNLPKGLADTSKIEIEQEVQGEDGRRSDGRKRIKKQINKVQILDPAVGTGTYLNEVIYEIHKKFKGQEGLWPSYVEKDLLPRLHGFELMMASYTMAHLKLGITLSELGYNGDDRLSVWLTNSLEAGMHEVPNLFMTKWLTEESNEASRIKSEMPVMVVIGNPPYAVSSSNKGEYIYNLLDDYKKDLNERNIQPLSDDYIKFIRYAENQVEKTGYGVVAMITNNSFIDGIIHRRMRKQLMETFDEIYILDLHGNSKKKETTPDGEKDDNVFDIQQGVSINIFVKYQGSSNIKKDSKVYHAELYGKRKEKYETLDKNNWSNIEWNQLETPDPNYFFIPKNYELQAKYEKYFKVSSLLTVNTSGIQTHRDNLVIANTDKELSNKIRCFFENTDKAMLDLGLKETKSWKTANALQNNTIDNTKITSICYRPFDIKSIYYDSKLIDRGRENIMKHFLGKENIGLCLMRSLVNIKTFKTVFITKNILDKNFYGFQTYLFPLYLYNINMDGSYEKTPNFDTEILKVIESQLGLKLEKDFSPEDLLDYIYALLHSPSYREKYQEFLKIDFPRVPYPKDKETFWGLVKLGSQLRNYHLMEHAKIEKYITTYPKSGDNIVVKKYPKYKEGKVYINETQYFDNVPEVAWKFYIGGYQPAQKWLKDRREQELSMEDIMHYQKIIVALTNTDRLMKEIDEIIKF